MNGEHRLNKLSLDIDYDRWLSPTEEEIMNRIISNIQHYKHTKEKVDKARAGFVVNSELVKIWTEFGIDYLHFFYTKCCKSIGYIIKAPVAETLLESIKKIDKHLNQ